MSIDLQVRDARPATTTETAPTAAESAAADSTAAESVAAESATDGAVVARPTTEPKRRHHLLAALRVALPVALLSVLIAVLAALVIVPRLAGWVPLTVLSGSMEPTIPTGSQVIVESVVGEADAARLQVGDVITVLPYPEDPTLVTHRIVSRVDTADGVQFTTQGDANDVVDDWEVTATQIRGEVRYWVPGAGYLATALDGQQKSLSILVVVGGLLSYAGVQVIGAVRERRRGRHAA